jgi:hypothetical protein
MNALVLSTLLHYIPIGILAAHLDPGYEGILIGYAAVIGTSTSLSAVWHYLEEPGGPLMYADYTMAAVSSIYSLQIIRHRNGTKLTAAIFFELLVAATNLAISLRAEHGALDYSTWHTVWHMLSALKSVYIALLTVNSYSKNSL